jgi:hypothetical protein
MNSNSGRTYTLANGSMVTIENGKWVVRVHVSARLEPLEGDMRTPRGLLPMIDPTFRWAQIYGVLRDQVQVYELTSREEPYDLNHCGYPYGYAGVTKDLLLVADQPFISVVFSDHELSLGRDLSRSYRRLIAAQQIHKGQLGRKPEIPNLAPEFGPQIKDAGDNWHTYWVPWKELSDLSGVGMADLVRGYSAFSPSRVYEPNLAVLLRGCWGTVMRAYDNGKMPESEGCYIEQQWGKPISLSELLACEDIETAMVPAAFARRVLWLTKFGYRPDGSLPDGAWELRLDKPAAVFNDHTLPIRTAEDFASEVIQLEQELSEEAFRLAAQSALGEAGWWADTPVMDDQGVMVYRNKFQSLTGFDGRLTIAVCFNTRGGQRVTTGNYYGGLLVVTDSLCDDPRRTPNPPLRLHFGPDSMVRETTSPDGRPCPQAVSDEIAVVVERFLASLGYM